MWAKSKMVLSDIIYQYVHYFTECRHNIGNWGSDLQMILHVKDLLILIILKGKPGQRPPVLAYLTVVFRLRITIYILLRLDWICQAYTGSSLLKLGH